MCSAVGTLPAPAPTPAPALAPVHAPAPAPAPVLAPVPKLPVRALKPRIVSRKPVVDMDVVDDTALEPSATSDDVVMTNDDNGETPRRTRAAGKRAAVQSPAADDPPAKKQQHIVDLVSTSHILLEFQFLISEIWTECMWSVWGVWPDVRAPD